MLMSASVDSIYARLSQFVSTLEDLTFVIVNQDIQDMETRALVSI